jgi:hypothetical protein
MNAISGQHSALSLSVVLNYSVEPTRHGSLHLIDCTSSIIFLMMIVEI